MACQRAAGWAVSPSKQAFYNVKTVPARGDRLGPSGFVSALGSIGSRSEPVIQTNTEHTQIY